MQTLEQELEVGNDETTPDGKITLEALECNAACDYAPVVMVNWEFFDNQTPQSAVQLAVSYTHLEPYGTGRNIFPHRQYWASSLSGIT